MSTISRSLFHRIFGSGDAPAGGRHLYSSPADRAVILALCRAFRPQVVVEIGVQRGCTARMLLDNGPWIQAYIGIDVPPGTITPLPGQLTEVPAVAGDLAAADPRFRAIVRPHGTADLTPADLPIADMVFIDDDHSEAGVTRSTALARAILRPGGICVWHDYVNSTVEVAQVIDNLNYLEGDHICLVDGSWMCFEIRIAGGAVLAPPAPPESGSGRVSSGADAGGGLPPAASTPATGASASDITHPPVTGAPDAAVPRGQSEAQLLNVPVAPSGRARGTGRRGSPTAGVPAAGGDA